MALIVVPYFGDLARFRPLLDQWFDSYREAGLRNAGERVVLLSDVNVEEAARAYDCGACTVDASGFADLIRPGQPFDRKGAIVCSWLLEFPYTSLVLDADAFLVRDPEPTLEPFRDCPIAMPVDDGALIHLRTPTLEEPFAGIRKLCAGVMFFGGGDRSRLVAGYRRAFEEIVALPKVPWSPPLGHLVEQYAWSVCARRRGGKILPSSMNWAPSHLGENPFAVVNHHYGFPKWRELGVKAPANC